MLVSINGLLQCPGVDYTATKNSISFSGAPMAGSVIELRNHRGVMAQILGDGSSYRFDVISEFEFEDNISRMLDEAVKLRHVPAVAEALERLQVIVELAKENG